MFEQAENGRDASDKKPVDAPSANGSVAEPCPGSPKESCKSEAIMSDQVENGEDASVVNPVDEVSLNGSVAEPSVSPTGNAFGQSDQDTAVDDKAGFVAGLSSPFEVELKDLEWNADTSDPDALHSLGASLKVLQINDIIVSPKSDAGKHRVIAGNRRCAAAALAGLTRLRARVYQGNASEIVSIVENAQRLDESPTSMLIRLRNALQGGTDRKEVREFLGATGKAKSTISDLLYGARLDEDRFLEVIASGNVFKAIANLRKRRPGSDVVPPVDPPAQATAAEDEQTRPGNLTVEHEIPTASAPSVNNGESQQLEDGSPASSRIVAEHRSPAPLSIVEAPPKTGAEGIEMLLARDGSVAERTVDPAVASGWASWREVESGLTEAKSETEAPANASQHTEPESGEPMIMDPDLHVALAECAQTDEEKTAAGDWSLAMVRPSGSRDVPVDSGLAQNAIAEIQRRCTGES